MLVGKVLGVKLIEHISEGLDLLGITIDFDELNIFGYYNEILEYLQKTVQYNIRKDMYKGKEIQIVANMVDTYVVQTLKEEENIKLIPDERVERQVCNFSIDTIKYGDYDSGCIAFLSGYEKRSSKKATWIDCSMIDKKSKMFILRIFTNNAECAMDAEEVIAAKVGHYIKFNITSDKFGYHTDHIELENTPVVVPPEVEIAISQIRKIVAEDQELISYMEQFNYIETLKYIIDGELGYHLVSIASEIYFIKAISNISNEYDTKLLIRAAITSRGYLLPSKTKFSRTILNTNKVLKSALSKDRELILLLDVFSEEEASSTKKVYIRISKFIKEIINERRGIVDEEISSNASIDAIRNEFGGLL